MALGHHVVWEEVNDRFLTSGAGINIVVEGFFPSSTQVIADAYAHGARFICIAPEEPTPRGFNGGVYDEWVVRQTEFPNAAKYFDGIFYLVPGSGSWYSQWAPAASVELGYAPSLVRQDDVEPIYDFGFFGSRSDRRLDICKQLVSHSGKRKALIFVTDLLDQSVRDQKMQEARVILQIRRHDYLGFVSSTRCNTALCLGRPVLAEPHLFSKPWNEIVKFSESLEAFFDDALTMRDEWKAAYAAQFARFSEKLTPEFCIGRALEEIKVM